MGRTALSDQLRMVIMRHKRIGYNLTVVRQSACIVTIAASFDCTPLDRASDSMLILT